MNEKRPLEGQVALVTGASSGLGRATALVLARAGASLALVARGAADLGAVADELSANGCRALPLPCDLADAAGVERAVSTARTELGQLRVLVNAAATDAPGPVSELSIEAWERVLSVNLRAVFVLSRLVIPDMIAARQGTIVNISSVAGKRGWANAAAYCASKFALTGFTQALGAELRPHGVRACLVCPGAMATHWGKWSPDDRPAERPASSSREALPPSDVAMLIAWIAAAPPELVLDEVIVTPLDEQGYP